MEGREPEIGVLCGGFGGARFVPPLLAAAGERPLTVVTNPGDDVDYLALEVWPDFDSVLYGAAGRFDEAQGWGIAGDSYRCVEALGTAGWFRMGDEDIAISLQRTAWLADGVERAEVARRCRELLGVAATIVPSAAEPHRTRVRARDQWMPFQEFVVRLRGAAPPQAVRVEPAAARATDQALAAVRADLVVLGPSNPLLSLMPILSTPGIVGGLQDAGRVLAVSSVVAGAPPRTAPEQGRFAVRARAMELLGLPHAPRGVAAFLAGLIDGLAIDAHDRAEAAAIEREHGIPVLVTDLLPGGEAGRAALARELLSFGDSLPRRAGARAPDGPLRAFLA